MSAHLPPTQLGWREDAACRDADVALFFSHDPDRIREALAYCERCPVRRPCLEEALATEERFGIRGGATEQERRQLSRRRTAA